MILDNYNIYIIGMVVSIIPPNNHAIEIKLNHRYTSVFSGYKAFDTISCILQLYKDDIEYIHMSIVKYDHNSSEIITQLNIINNECNYIADKVIRYDTLTTIINKKMLITQLELLPEINDIIITTMSSLYLSL